MMPRVQNGFGKRLPVKWTSTRWSERIVVIPALEADPQRRFSLQRRLNNACQTFRFSPAMSADNLLVASRKRRATGSYRFQSQPMNSLVSRPGRSRAGFTLVELLVVISIIAVLASMALPVLSRAKVKAQVGKATVDINGLAGAIEAYYSTYSRMPVSKVTRDSLENPDQTPDFTFGTYLGPAGFAKNKKGFAQSVGTFGLNPRLQKSNSEVIAILRDLDYFRNGVPTPNVGHALNPQHLVFLNAKDVDTTRPGGVGVDGVYRDPWGMPYIISIDLNADDRTRDGFYCQDVVSADPSGRGLGLNGMSKSAGGGVNTFEHRSTALVWSLGPDGAVDATVSANKGANKDNILSWK